MLRKYTDINGNPIWLDLDKATAIRRNMVWNKETLKDDLQKGWQIVYGPDGYGNFTIEYIDCKAEDIDRAINAVTLDQAMKEPADDPAARVIQDLMGIPGDYRWTPSWKDQSVWMKGNMWLSEHEHYTATVEARTVRRTQKDIRVVILNVSNGLGENCLSVEWPCPGPGTAAEIHKRWMNWEPTEEKDEDDDTGMFSIVPHDEGDVCL